MGFLEFILLCLVQGVTELLPISSSGHLVLINSLLSPNPLSVGMVILLHVATALVTILVLWATLARIWHSSKSVILERLRFLYHPRSNSLSNGSGFKLLKLIALSCIFTGLPVFFIKDGIDILFADPSLVGFALMVNGFILLVARSRILGKKTMFEIGWGSACLIGFAQFVGVVPGISRLGITILVALLCGMLWTDAVTYSLLISIPVILAGAIMESAPEIHNLAATSLEMSAFYILIGLLGVALTGLAAIRFLRGRLGQKSLGVFAVWCWTVGLVVVLLNVGFFHS